MLKKIYKYNIQLKLDTGLHIGGSNDAFDIGGADSTVIKNPLTKEPYIPGSSFKGKIRSLLTQKYGKLTNDKNDIVIDDKTIANLFQPVESDAATIQASRAIFRDLFLSENSRKELQNYMGEGNFTELKAENSISLLQGKAANPRLIERVPAGAEFDGEVILMIYDRDDEEGLKEALEEGFDLLEYNYLGGSGTRGYGKVTIKKDVEEVQI